MTGNELQTWRKRHRLKAYQAASALGVSRATYARWESLGISLPRHVDLACAALTMGLRGFSEYPNQPDTRP